MARLYANENLPQPVVIELRRLGHDVLIVMETGKAGRSWPDDEVFDFACAEQRAVLTMNRRHFIRIHGERPHHQGIVVCRYDPDFTGQAARIHEVIAAVPDLAGQLIRVNRPVRS